VLASELCDCANFGPGAGALPSKFQQLWSLAEKMHIGSQLEALIKRQLRLLFVIRVSISAQDRSVSNLATL